VACRQADCQGGVGGFSLRSAVETFDLSPDALPAIAIGMAGVETS
jgi:hypothetical protein